MSNAPYGNNNTPDFEELKKILNEAKEDEKEEKLLKRLEVYIGSW